MSVFEMVKYHAQEYPPDIPLRIEELAAHFDVAAVTSSNLQGSFHTEYSYGKRKFDSELVKNFSSIVSSQKDGIPQLWKDEQWAYEFAQFVFALSNGTIPAIIEIHPPFNDYTDLNVFIRNYKVFENQILEFFPDVCLLIENRCGSVYKGGHFLVSKVSDIDNLCNLLTQNNLRLKIAFDIPQIYTAHNAKTPDHYIELLEKAQFFRQYIGGIHLWGKRKSENGRKVSHCGDLTSYFDGDNHTKALFLQQFSRCFDDNICRKMVLEVNSGNKDLLSILTDLKTHGVIFE